jgi:phage/plasmid primase-like uncharacterized protein
MTIDEQIASHITFLKGEQIEIDELLIDREFVRCDIIGAPPGRGELCYKTKRSVLRNGYVGLATWLRTKGGEIKTYKTYGHSEEQSSLDKNPVVTARKNSEASEKAKLFWDMSDQTGEAEYLLKKGVGYYGIRFRQNEYGKIAVIPLEDTSGAFCSYQLINADGSKRFAKDVEIAGLFHMLHRPINGFTIGIAESYVTAASCFEVTGITMVTSFSSENLKSVAIALRKRFPQSALIIFGDDDRHLKENKGRCAAYATQKELGTGCQVVMPDFENYPVSRDFSDWNDYVREMGVRATREVIQKKLNKN